MTVRMTDTVRSLLAIIDAGTDADGAILLRALYEKIVIFCWIATDPEPNLTAWIENAKVYRRKLHNDALGFGVSLYADEELAEASELKTLPALADLAFKVDAHWGPLLQGFRTREGSLDNDVLTFRGLYMTYRLGSRDAHAQPESLEDHGDFAAYPIKIEFPKRSNMPGILSVGISLFAQALVVCHEAVGWPDPDRVRSINDAMYLTPPPEDRSADRRLRVRSTLRRRSLAWMATWCPHNCARREGLWLCVFEADTVDGDRPLCGDAFWSLPICRARRAP
jgi:hypothetical protein